MLTSGSVWATYTVSLSDDLTEDEFNAFKVREQLRGPSRSGAWGSKRQQLSSSSSSICAGAWQAGSRSWVAVSPSGVQGTKASSTLMPRA